MEARRRLHVKTSRSCNNNCVFCLDDRARRRDADRAKVARLLAAARRRGIGEMLFTCGEPTLHPALPAFAGMAARAGFSSIGLVTNGRRLAYRAYCAALLDAGVNEVTLSIHGHEAREHDALTRARGSFAQGARGLANLRLLAPARGLRLVTSSVVTARGLATLGATLRWLDGFAPDTMVLNVVEPSGEARARYGRLMTTYREIAAAVARALEGFAGRGRVTVEGIPLCLCAGFAGLVGTREEIHLEQGDRFLRLGTDRGHVKAAACRSCGAAARCPGLFRGYAALRGTGELAPL